MSATELEQLRAENERLKAEFTKLKAACELAASWNQFFGVKVGAERKAEQDELDQLRGLLLSGQCVDLSKLDDIDLGEKSRELYRRRDRPTHDGQDLKAWLIEKAGVKL